MTVIAVLSALVVIGGFAFWRYVIYLGQEVQQERHRLTDGYISREIA